MQGHHGSRFPYDEAPLAGLGLTGRRRQAATRTRVKPPKAKTPRPAAVVYGNIIVVGPPVPASGRSHRDVPGAECDRNPLSGRLHPERVDADYSLYARENVAGLHLQARIVIIHCVK